MITWMQHHNKYLVITIWIATIAFIGAGFVGWGAYDLNTNRAKSVAKVGNRSISVQEFQSTYSNTFNYYNQQLGGKLTQEEADKMHLERIVMQNVINEALLLDFANDLGFVALKKDIEKALIADKNFQVNGEFSKQRYYSLLSEQRISTKDYEEGLKKEILLNKLQNALKMPATKRELEVFASALFMQDKLTVSTITINPSEISVNLNGLKKYWENNKDNFLTKKQYVVGTISIGLGNELVKDDVLKSFWKSKKYNYKDKDGKLLSFQDAKNSALIDYKLKKSKTNALETYLKLKKGEIRATDKSIIYDDNKTFPVEKLRTANKGQVLKPIARPNGYIIVKLQKVLLPRVKSFEEAKPLVLVKYKQNELLLALEKKAKARLDLFNGQNIGFVSRDSLAKINGLNDTQSSQFINYVFDQTKAKGYKIFGNKAVMFRVLEQKLLNQNKFQLYKSLITQSVITNKKSELNKNLLVKLRSMYKIEQYYKGK